MKNWVEGLIRDSNNPSPLDKSFPQFRYFDWYSGHSWSQVGEIRIILIIIINSI
jgi:endoglucanase Acf2